jgi:hypothetical protein
VVVDAHGAELAEDVLPEQAVEVQFEHAFQIFEVHHRDGLPEPLALAQDQIRGAAKGISGQADASGFARILRQSQLVVAVSFGADNGAIGAGIEQKRGAIAVHFAFHEDHGLDGAEWDVKCSGASAIRQRDEEEKEERQHAAGGL